MTDAEDDVQRAILDTSVIIGPGATPVPGLVAISAVTLADLLIAATAHGARLSHATPTT